MSKKELLEWIENERDNLGSKYREDGGGEGIEYDSEDSIKETLLLQFKSKVEELINE